jgi:sugar transferase EpsL
MDRAIYQSFFKRLFDLIGAIAGLVCLAPVMAILAILVYSKSGRPILFRQRRPGRDGNPFVLIKYRTMTNTQSTHGILLPDEQRITAFGQWLRNTSLDELPTLWNVFRGDMSLVGPRPLLMEYLTRYTPEQARRHDVKPGITGWAQIHGRNAITWEEKFRYDSQYAQHISAWLDLQILIFTVWTVLSRQGVSADSHATMPCFTGKNTSGSHCDKAA